MNIERIKYALKESVIVSFMAIGLAALVILIGLIGIAVLCLIAFCKIAVGCLIGYLIGLTAFGPMILAFLYQCGIGCVTMTQVGGACGIIAFLLRPRFGYDRSNEDPIVKREKFKESYESLKDTYRDYRNHED